MKLRLFILLFSAQLNAQGVHNKHDSLTLEFHQKSMLYSAIIPGAGQVRNSIASDLHNNAIWKVPIIYAGLGATGYLLVQNQQTQLSLKTEYTNRKEGGLLDPQWSSYDDPAILQLYRQYLDWRDLSILGITAIYLFQIAEAGAEAHFVNFDTGPDLSFTVDPMITTTRLLGVKIQLSFR